MVRLVLLDEDVDVDVDPPDEARAASTTASVRVSESVDDDRSNPNLNHFSAALSCYPIVSQLARSLDLTALHELSRTCRQVRANLLQYRSQLIARTLQCENDKANPLPRADDASHSGHVSPTARGPDAIKTRRLTSGRVGACARDMVGECHRCGTVVCRNCVIKPPPTHSLRSRHRRLCRTCMRLPPDHLTRTSPSPHLAESSSLPETFSDPFGSIPDPLSPNPPSSLPPPLSRPPCTCSTSGVWLCQPCGSACRPSDTTYLRGWTWRTRYSACGGLGAGLGEGNEGVECGRGGGGCAGARMVEKDVDCDGAELEALEEAMRGTRWGGNHAADGGANGRGWEAGGGYATREIVGIGGKVKRKVRKRVPVGAIVKEYEDERVTEVFLGREQSGVNRSWCSWCERVVLGKKDLGGGKGARESVGSVGSADSAA